MRMITPSGDLGIEMARKVVEQMRQATVNFGVTPQTLGLVEELYAEQLAALDRHFETSPHLLGGRPCVTSSSAARGSALARSPTDSSS